MTNLPAPSTLPIAAVERDSGLSKDTLRVWERRYGFPAPLRDAKGERIYPPEQVATLRLLRRLVEAGHRPGQVVGRPAHELAALADALDAGEPGTPEAAALLGLMRSNQVDALKARLSALLVGHGLREFTTRTAPTLIRAVGTAWGRGELEIHQEHLFTEQLAGVLRTALAAPITLGTPQGRPTTLLTTLPGEPHALGLLMAEVLFNLAGCRCIGLGVQTPVSEIAAAVRAHGADVAALSFSSFFAVAEAQAALASLRAVLPPDVEIWAGGASSALHPGPGVRVVRELDAVEQEVARWRRDNLHAPTR